MSRSSVIRKMNGVVHALPCMRYPYRYIGQDEYGCHYALQDILRPIVTEPAAADAGDFPRNIQEHFWIRGGEKDGDSWLSCGVLQNGNYFFYTGGCDYTGFDCQGGMNLWISTSWQTIVDHAMSRSDYELYVEQTAVPPATEAGEAPWPVLTAEEFWAAQRARTRCYDCRGLGVSHDHPYMEGKMICSICHNSQSTEEDALQEQEGPTAFEQYALGTN